MKSVFYGEIYKTEMIPYYKISTQNYYRSDEEQIKKYQRILKYPEGYLCMIPLKLNDEEVLMSESLKMPLNVNDEVLINGKASTINRRYYDIKTSTYHYYTNYNIKTHPISKDQKKEAIDSLVSVIENELNILIESRPVPNKKENIFKKLLKIFK